tara:strand:- start:249 stop:383 length:135 start_codon:yes stop_codon:yes gene_type:complete
MKCDCNCETYYLRTSGWYMCIAKQDAGNSERGCGAMWPKGDEEE